MGASAVAVPAQEPVSRAGGQPRRARAGERGAADGESCQLDLERGALSRITPFEQICIQYSVCVLLCMSDKEKI